jgi:hypothetical protein
MFAIGLSGALLQAVSEIFAFARGVSCDGRFGSHKKGRKNSVPPLARMAIPRSGAWISFGRTGFFTYNGDGCSMQRECVYDVA